MYDLYSDLPFGQYVWNGALSDLQEYVSKIPDGETLDIRRCRLDPRCVSVLMNNIPRINIINSEEEDLNRILQHNRNIKLQDTSKIVRKNIVAIFYDEDGRRIEDYLNELKKTDKDVVWQIPTSVIGTKYLNNYILVLLASLMHFPKRKFDIHNVQPGLFAEVAQKYFGYEDYVSYDKIYVTLGNGRYMLFKFTDVDKHELHINGIGVLTLDNLIMRYKALPGWLGNERVIGTPRQSILERVYADVKFADRIESDSGDYTIRVYIAKYGGDYE